MRPVNVEDKLKEEIAEFKGFMDAYKLSVNQKDFVSEIDKMVQLMECRFKKIK